MKGKTQVARQAAVSAPVNSGLLQRQCACGQHTIAGSQCEECCKSDGEVPSIVHDVLASPGEPLDAQARGFFEARFVGDFANVPARISASPVRDLKLGPAGDPTERAAESAAARALAGEASTASMADFSRVFIHRDARAAEAARLVGARAFTVGSHIVFGDGEYRPTSFGGQRLLAHELAHVVQQTGPTIRRKTGEGPATPAPPTPATSAGTRQPEDPAPTDQKEGTPEEAKALPDAPVAIDSQQKKIVVQKAADAAPKGKPKPVEAPKSDRVTDEDEAAGPQVIGDLSTGDLALVDTELAEHQRWGAAAKMVGEAESGERAEFIAKKGADASNFTSSAAQGAGMAVGIKVAEKLLGKVFLKVAVTRLGASAVKFTPVPGIGAMIGGAMSAFSLATRDWKETGETIGKFGVGASYYDTLANDIEAISTVVDIATDVLNVIAGIIGAISFGMWAVTIVTVGVAAPLAFTLSAIAGGIGLAAMILDGINALVLKELVTIFRILDTFTSDADPREVVTEGSTISQSAGAASGFLGGLAGGQLVEAGAKRFGKGKKPPPKAAEHQTPPAAQGEGALVKAEVPPEGLKPSAEGAPAPTAADAPKPAGAPAEAHATAPEASAPVADSGSGEALSGEPPSGGVSAEAHATAPEPGAPVEDSGSGKAPAGEPPSGGGGHEPPSGQPPEGKQYGPIDERSFAELNDTVAEMDRGGFGDKLQAGAQHAQQAPAKAPAGTRWGKGAYRLLRTLLRTEEARPPGTQAQHQTKYLASTEGTQRTNAAGVRTEPRIRPADRMTPAQISRNRLWLQSRKRLPATLLLTDPKGGGTRYFIGTEPAPHPQGQQLDLFSPNAAPPDASYNTEHKFMDNSRIPAAADHIRAQNPGGIDPNLVNLWAGADARWGMQGIPGQGDWSWQPGATGQKGVQLNLAGVKPVATRPAIASPAAPTGQLALPFDAAPSNPNQLDLFSAARPGGGEPSPIPQPGNTQQPAPVPQPGPAAQPMPLDPIAAGAATAGEPATKVRVATGDQPADAPRIRVAPQGSADSEALREAQAQQELEDDREAAKAEPKALRVLPRPPSPPGPPKPPHPSKKDDRDEPEADSDAPGPPAIASDWREKLKRNAQLVAGMSQQKKSTTERIVYGLGGPVAGAFAVEAMRGAVKSHSEPVVRHVNPHYAPPPCTPEQITELEKDILQALAARAEAEQIAYGMKAQEKHHKENEHPIDRMTKGTARQITATEAHQQAVARHGEANTKKDEKEGAVQSKLDHYSEQAGKLAAIKAPMKVFKGFTGLAAKLPDDPFVLMAVKIHLARMNADTANFLKRLDGMDEAIEKQKAGKPDRDRGIAADGKALADTSQQADKSKEVFDECKDTTDDLQKENQTKLQDAGKMCKEANQNAYALAADAQQKKVKKESMAAALQAWAENHRKARHDALEAMQKNLLAQGYKITEVKEL